jgi:AAA domain
VVTAAMMPEVSQPLAVARQILLDACASTSEKRTAVSDCAAAIHPYNDTDAIGRLFSTATGHGGLSKHDAHRAIAEGKARAKQRPNGQGSDVRNGLDVNSLAGPARDDAKRTQTAPSKPAPFDIIRLRFFSELTQPAPKPWLIKNVIAKGETSSWIAPPGKGKSGLLTDIAVHLAAGLDWRGYRTKCRQGVVYFALERANLVARRLAAYKLRDGLSDLPIAVAGQIIDLFGRNCADAIVDAIKRAQDRFGLEVGLAVFDTYSKGIAAGGGDENQAKDQNIAIANLRRVVDQLGIHNATIGHTGKDEARGERGSNAKLADVDVQVQISGDQIKTATVTKANDQTEGELTSFRLEPYDFGADEDGDPFRTFMVSREPMTSAVTSDRNLSDRQKLALEALANCDSKPAPPALGLPAGIQVIAVDEWRDEMFSRGVLDKKAANPRTDLQRIRHQLTRRRLIGERDDFVWLVQCST